MRDMDTVLAGGLRDRHALGLERRLPPPQRLDIDLGSNDYLGLAADSRVVDAAVGVLKEYGAGSTGARLLSGNLLVHEQLEQTLAAFKGVESALLFPSGYQAAVGAIPALAAGGDLILSDELNHASLIDACSLSRATVRVYSHNDLGSLRSLLETRKRFRRCLIVTDGVFSMDGDVADLVGLVALRDEFDCWLMVDDAHGTGVLGERGSGSAEYCGVTGGIDIQMGTLSKALGASGGFVAGSSILVQFLLNNARSFIYTTGPSPASSGAALEALKIVAQEPERRKLLRHNAAYLRSGLRSVGLPMLEGPTPIIPIVFGGSEVVMRLGEELRPKLGIAAIRPPTVPEGSARLRLAVKSTHTKEQLDLVVETLDTVLRQFGWRQLLLDGME